MSDGHLALLDHPRGEPKRSLKRYELAGAAPTGCYGILALWQHYTTPRLAAGIGVALAAGIGVAWVGARTDPLLVHQPAVADACHVLRAALRWTSPPFIYARRVCLPRGKPMWVISADRERADVVARHGPPAMLVGYAPADAVCAREGFVRADVQGGAILWDITLPGMNEFIAQGESVKLPGPLVLLRLTRRLLNGWQGVLCAASAWPSSSWRPSCPSARRA
jgi:hypothetical protein